MPLYILSIFLSAFLLFLVQPLIGKAILPWFGGTSAVWSVVMLFFQTILTGGYAYAFYLTGRRRGKGRYWIHLILIGSCLAVLGYFSIHGIPPILPGEGFRQVDNHAPVRDLLKILTLFVGLPGLILAANSTLVQTWFSSEFPKRSPYWLYALSNAGSLLALFFYPIFLEPAFDLITQGWIWTGLFLVFSLVSLFVFSRVARKSWVREQIPDLVPDPEGSGSWKKMDAWLWIGFSAAGSISLLATTSRLTQEVAPIPLLWILPLAVYLTSFILSFSGGNGYSRPVYLTLLTAASGGVFYDLQPGRIHFYFQLGIYLLFLFSACMVAHGELYRLRPGPPGLARFYLLVSVGGAGGGIFVNLISPLIFNGYHEFFVGWFLVFGLAAFQFFREWPKEKRWDRPTLRPPVMTAFSLMILGFALSTILSPSNNSLFQERNFYGVSKVSYSSFREANQYVNGVTMHGFQFLSEEKQKTPTAYFWRGSGIAIIIRNLPDHEEDLHVGVMGLGIGTLAAHGKEGDTFRFYEIDPAVIGLAQGEGGYFSYLADSPADISLIEGDARLSLERELEEGGGQEFDLLVMDAFSSDSVPVHLLTREAFELYLAHLAPDGVIAVNISNNYLDLQPVIWRAAEALELYPILIDPPLQSYHPLGVRSRWAFLARDEAVFDFPEIHANKESLDDFHPGIQLWTDQYSNLFQIIW